MMPSIRIEDDVFQALKSIAEPFTDTPNSVIRRLLEERGALKGSKAPIAPSNDEQAAQLTPQPTYEKFLLHVLATKFNGRGAKHDVTKTVLTMMTSRNLIGPAELELVSTGETKAANTVAWGRNALKERGFIKRISARGVWELTSEGMAAAKHVSLPENRESL